ncbi:MAG: hypothetical protein NTX95_04510 [Actinobacteria bacterium]|nr:hypothetical protein [Actinomycetota bacterium]
MHENARINLLRSSETDVARLLCHSERTAYVTACEVGVDQARVVCRLTRDRDCGSRRTRATMGSDDADQPPKRGAPVAAQVAPALWLT